MWSDIFFCQHFKNDIDTHRSCLELLNCQLGCTSLLNNILTNSLFKIELMKSTEVHLLHPSSVLFIAVFFVMAVNVLTNLFAIMQ